MRRLFAVLLAMLAAAPFGALLEAGTALAADSSPALVPGATDGSVPVRTPGLDASNRWIVVLRGGTRLDAARARAGSLGIAQDRVFSASFRGYSARLTTGQLGFLRADANVEAVVPDDIVSLTAQKTPTGVSRVYGQYNPITQIGGHDRRVNADVAIVDTGIDPHHVDLNVAGGYSCSTSSPTAWFDPNGHGTHVAGTVGALDNGIGVVGVAPGVRLWSVRILDSVGNGRRSWYVCGLDWIAAQKDPGDPTKPLFESVNMSVAKAGHDDANCGYTNSDILHRAICRVVAAGITVVAAAGNNSLSASGWVPAAYNEVITVSALADTDGRPGNKGGRACFSWGGYDQDDTFADFSNYGSDVDIMAPGKCILSTLPGNAYGTKSGTSMATPLVAGAAALWKSSRPNATPAQVKAALLSMGNSNWRTWTDPDKWHEPLLDVSWIVDAGDFAIRNLQVGSTASSAGATRSVPMNLVRAEDFTLPVDLSVAAPGPIAATLTTSHFEPGAPNDFKLNVTIPAGTPSGAYLVTVTASDGGRERSTTYRVVVDSTAPVATAPALNARTGTVLGKAAFSGAAGWAPATDAIGVYGYQTQWSVNGGAWGGVASLAGSTHSSARTFSIGRSYAMRLRARDAAGNWSPWVKSRVLGSVLVQDKSSSIARTGTWHRTTSKYASGGTLLYSRQAGATATLRFSGKGVAIVAPRGPGAPRSTSSSMGRRSPRSASSPRAMPPGASCSPWRISPLARTRSRWLRTRCRAASGSISTRSSS
ncbi:MAG: S8 family serine peptidase [Chloroflexota bacterium]